MIHDRIERRNQRGNRVYVLAINLNRFVGRKITDERFCFFINKHGINSFWKIIPQN